MIDFNIIPNVFSCYFGWKIINENNTTFIMNCEDFRWLLDQAFVYAIYLFDTYGVRNYHDYCVFTIKWIFRFKHCKSTTVKCYEFAYKMVKFGIQPSFHQYGGGRGGGRQPKRTRTRGLEGSGGDGSGRGGRGSGRGGRGSGRGGRGSGRGGRASGGSGRGGRRGGGRRGGGRRGGGRRGDNKKKTSKKEIDDSSEDDTSEDDTGESGRSGDNNDNNMDLDSDNDYKMDLDGDGYREDKIQFPDEFDLEQLEPHQVWKYKQHEYDNTLTVEVNAVANFTHDNSIDGEMDNNVDNLLDDINCDEITKNFTDEECLDFMLPIFEEFVLISKKVIHNPGVEGIDELKDAIKISPELTTFSKTQSVEIASMYSHCYSLLSKPDQQLAERLHQRLMKRKNLKERLSQQECEYLLNEWFAMQGGGNELMSDTFNAFKKAIEEDSTRKVKILQLPFYKLEYCILILSLLLNKNVQNKLKAVIDKSFKSRNQSNLMNDSNDNNELCIFGNVWLCLTGLVMYIW